MLFLQKRAEELGVDEDLLDDAEDNAATIELCVAKAVVYAAGGGGGEVAETPAPDLQEPLCKTFIFGTHTNAQARKQNEEGASADIAPEEELAIGLVRSLERTFGLDACVSAQPICQLRVHTSNPPVADRLLVMIRSSAVCSPSNRWRSGFGSTFQMSACTGTSSSGSRSACETTTLMANGCP
jgi:hypothetical protein